MKKYIILLILLTIITASSSAQSFALSVFAGPNLSTFNPDQQGTYEVSKSAKFGYQAGLLTGISRNHFSVETGAIFQQFNSESGFTESSIGGGSMGTLKYSVRYLQIPLNFLYTTSTSYGKIFFGGGPYISFGLSGSVENISTGSDQGITLSGDITTPYKFNQYGASNKTDDPDYGLKLKAGTLLWNKLLVMLSVDNGMRYLFNGQDYESHDLGLKNTVFSISLGYSIF